MNNGNSSIQSGDFSVPVKIAFSDLVQILSARVVNTDPKDLGVTIALKDDAITLQPLLLNGHDSITIRVLLTGRPLGLTATGRIVGVKKIVDQRRRESKRSVWKLLLLSIPTFLLLWFISGYVLLAAAMTIFMYVTAITPRGLVDLYRMLRKGSDRFVSPDDHIV